MLLVEGKYAFKIDTYKLIFSKYVINGENTCDDEVLADMEEPRGTKISVLPGKYSHHVATCKAFATTTTNGRLLIAVFDLYGRFFECYHMQLNELKNVVVKKAFGGMNISFYGKTQFGGLTMKMYIANHQFGTDLKEQKNHLKLFAEHLSNKNMAVEITEKKAIDETISENQSIEEPQSKQSRINPMQDLFGEIIRLGDILDENEIGSIKSKDGTTEEKINEVENTLLINLPEDYKNILLLSNGLRYQGTEIYPVELVREIEVDESERNKYYVIGSYIGDGSHIVTDSKGNVYYLDHVTGMEKTTFSDFINQWLIDILKDELAYNGLDEK